METELLHKKEQLEAIILNRDIFNKKKFITLKKMAGGYIKNFIIPEFFIAYFDIIRLERKFIN
jgi:hypothetical protein